MRFLAVLTLGLLLVGCHGAPEPFEIDVRGVAPLNVNEQGESTPVGIRLFQLKDDARFKAATFEALWTDDVQALKGDRLTEPTVLSILPGGSSDEPTMVDLGKLNPAARFIGVLALFPQKPESGVRRLILPIAPGKQLIELHGFQVVHHEHKD